MKKSILIILLLVSILCFSACDETTGEPPHEHTELVLSAVPATCTETGLAEGKKCSSCNEIIVAQETIEKLPHTEEPIPAVTASCTTDGLTEGKKCSVCNEILVAQEVIKASHAWNAGTITTEPTCTEMGVKTSECDNCDATKTEDVNANGHSYATEWTIDLAPTCTTEGSKSHHCTVCGDKTDITVVDANGHKWNAGTITTEPTCTEKGVKTSECDNCDATKTEDVKANGHNYSSIVTNKTCAANGRITFTCPTCDDTYEELIAPISISIAHVGTSSSTMNGYGRFSLSYKITTSDGYGIVLCKTELFKTSSANSVSQMDYTDFSDSNYQVSYAGYEDTINEYYLVITAKDDANNITICKVDLGSTTITEQYVKDDHHYSYIDDKCTICGKLIEYTEGLTYELINNGTEYAVSGIGIATDSNIIIPRIYNGKPVTSIGASAFKECQTIINVRVPNSVKTIGSNAFRDSSVQFIELFDGIESIGDFCFYLSELKMINLPNSIKNIGERSFTFSKIEEVEIPEGIDTIRNSTFYCCWELKKVTLPKSLRTIEAQAFYDCEELSSIIIPSNVTSIGDDAFKSCDQITEIFIPKSVNMIEAGAFTWCSNLRKIEVSEDNTYFYVVNNCLIERNSKRLMAVAKEFILPTDGSVEIIAGSTFSDTKFSIVTIPYGITEIEALAFSFSDISSITLPNTLKSIGMYAFSNANALSFINFNGTIAEWRLITKESKWDDETGNYTIHCTDGDLTKAEA